MNNRPRNTSTRKCTPSNGRGNEPTSASTKHATGKHARTGSGQMSHDRSQASANSPGNTTPYRGGTDQPAQTGWTSGPAFRFIILPLVVTALFVAVGTIVSCAGGFAVL